MGKSKRGAKDAASKFDGFGVDFKCKLIGISDVPVARGDDICQEALTKLTAIALRKNKEEKHHKQRITVNITFKGIRILDEASERIDYAHPIQRISFISHDNNDKRTFGYIVGTRDGYKLFAIKAMKEAEQITKTLKELFQEVFERHQAQKNADPDKENAEPTETDGSEERFDDNQVDEVAEEAEKESADPFLVDWGQLNEQIQVMQNDGMTRSDTADLFTDFDFEAKLSNDSSFGNDFQSTTTQNIDFNPFGENTATAAVSEPYPTVDFFGAQPVSSVTTGSVKSSEDLSLLNAPPTVPKQQESPDAPLLMNDPFAELKKNINELHKQNQMQQQQQFTYQQAGPFANMQPNPYQQAPMTNPYGQQPQANNPFGNTMYAGAPLNPGMQQAPVLPPRPTPVPGPNPFLTQHSVTNPMTSPTDQGWTVNKPSPAPRVDLKKPAVSGSDPFAFLDNQTGGKPQVQQRSVTSGNANNDIFDLLG